MTLRDNANGFTIIELMVALAVSTLVLAAIYGTHRIQLKSHITQQKIVEMQQNARAAMFAMERDIKVAGYDPTGSAGATILTADDDEIIFRVDRNGDGDFITPNPPPDDRDPYEEVRYALTADNGLGMEIWTGGLQTIADNIDVLDFVYLDGDGNRLGPTPLDAVNRALVSSVQITLIARSGENVPALMMKQTDTRTYTNQQGDILLDRPNDKFRRIILTADILCRNLGI